ncbi:uncharacterized protein [Argopecten irradians]|uniref:uncharacterized protein n=1 Tax=Argopecten irradians TaxID=31199 RepID=UPI003720DB98
MVVDQLMVNTHSDGRPTDGSTHSDGRPTDGSTHSDGRPTDGSTHSDVDQLMVLHILMEDQLIGSKHSDGRPTDGSTHSDSRPADGSKHSDGRPTDGSTHSDGKPTDGSTHSDGRPTDGSTHLLHILMVDQLTDWFYKHSDGDPTDAGNGSTDGSIHSGNGSSDGSTHSGNGSTDDSTHSDNDVFDDWLLTGSNNKTSIDKYRYKFDRQGDAINLDISKDTSRNNSDTSKGDGIQKSNADHRNIDTENGGYQNNQNSYRPNVSDQLNTTPGRSEYGPMITDNASSYNNGKRYNNKSYNQTAEATNAYIEHTNTTGTPYIPRDISTEGSLLSQTVHEHNDRISDNEILMSTDTNDSITSENSQYEFWASTNATINKSTGYPSVSDGKAFSDTSSSGNVSHSGVSYLNISKNTSTKGTERNPGVSNLNTSIEKSPNRSDSYSSVSNVNTSIDTLTNRSDSHGNVSNLNTSIDTPTNRSDSHGNVSNLNTSIDTPTNGTESHSSVSKLNSSNYSSMSNLNSWHKTSPNGTDRHPVVSNLNISINTSSNGTDSYSSLLNLNSSIDASTNTTDSHSVVSNLSTSIDTPINGTDSQSGVSNLSIAINTPTKGIDSYSSVSNLNTSIDTKLNGNDRLSSVSNLNISINTSTKGSDSYSSMSNLNSSNSTSTDSHASVSNLNTSIDTTSNETDSYPSASNLNSLIDTSPNETDRHSSVSNLDTSNDTTTNGSDNYLIVSNLNISIDTQANGTDSYSIVSNLNTSIDTKSNDTDKYPSVSNLNTSIDMSTNETDRHSSVSNLNTSNDTKSNDTDKYPSVSNLNTSIDMSTNETDSHPGVYYLNTSIDTQINGNTSYSSVSNQNTSIDTQINGNDSYSSVSNLNTSIDTSTNGVDSYSSVSNFNTSIDTQINGTDSYSSVANLNNSIYLSTNGTQSHSSVSNVNNSIDTPTNGTDSHSSVSKLNISINTSSNAADSHSGVSNLNTSTNGTTIFSDVQNVNTSMSMSANGTHSGRSNIKASPLNHTMISIYVVESDVPSKDSVKYRTGSGIHDNMTTTVDIQTTIVTVNDNDTNATMVNNQETFTASSDTLNTTPSYTITSGSNVINSLGHNNRCTPDDPESCAIEANLKCLKTKLTEDYRCQCDEMEFWDKKRCIPRAGYNEDCQPDFYESCRYKPDLKCILSGETYTCRCGEEDSVYWDTVSAECKPRPGYDEQCQPDLPDNCRPHHELKCLPSVTSPYHTCQCENSNETYWDPKHSMCRQRFQYGISCNNNVTNSCLHTAHLQCLESQVSGLHICRCANETTHFWNPNTTECKLRPEHGGSCHKDYIDSCKHNQELMCLLSESSGEYTCQCDDEEKKFWDSAQNRCVMRPSFGDDCKPSFVESCMFPSELKCKKVEGSDNFTCRCSDEDQLYWNGLFEVCTTRPEYGEMCDEEFPDSCLYSPELSCQPSNGFGESYCQCNDEFLTFWDPVDLVCKTRPEFGDVCDLSESCKYKSQLKCLHSPHDDVKTCQCENPTVYFWDSDDSVCSKRADHGGDCLPGTERSCLYDTELQCLPTDNTGTFSCQCPGDATMYWDSNVHTCKPKSAFNGPCDDNFTDSCSFHGHLKCLPSVSGNNTCQCENGSHVYWNPEINECLIRPGFGNSCDSSYRDSCLFNHHLHCVRSNNTGLYECQCPNTDNHYWDHTTNICRKRIQYGETCDPDLSDSCKYSDQLRCLVAKDNASYTCQCTDESELYWDTNETLCMERRGYGIRCDATYIDSCRYNSHLDCKWDDYRNMSICQCKNESTTFWSLENSTCPDRPVYGGDCRPDIPDSCIHNLYLTCIQDGASGGYTCLCKDEDNSYWDSVESACKSRPDYGDSCEAGFVDSCKYKDELQCLPSGSAGNNFTCRCPDEENMFWDSHTATCKTRQDYGAPCLRGVEGSCHYEDQLKCLAVGDSGNYTCRCEEEERVFWNPYSKLCESRPEYGSPCQSEFPSSCLFSSQLRCVKMGGTGKSTCQCANETETFWNPKNNKCQTRPRYGETCNLNGSCIHNVHLKCVRPEDSVQPTCRCEDESLLYWDGTVSECKSRPEYGNECDADTPGSCMYQSELECVQTSHNATTNDNNGSRFVCQCPKVQETYWDSKVKKCTPRLVYGGVCDPDFSESCQFDQELKCLPSQSGNFTCQCQYENSTYWDPDQTKCDTRSLYGEQCDAAFTDSCVHNTELQCVSSSFTGNSTCLCKNETSTFWNPEEAVCRSRPEYGYGCDPEYPESCIHNSQLSCLSSSGGNGTTVCQCRDEAELYWDLSEYTCKQRPGYGDRCDVMFNDSCVFNDELVCLRSGNTSACMCPDETQSFWNNQTATCTKRPQYGKDCDSTFPGSCSYNHQLTCLRSQNSNRTVCQCRDENTTYWDGAVSQCRQRPDYAGSCDPKLPESCIHKSHLKCTTINGTNTSLCRCADEREQYWDPAVTQCHTRPGYGDSCSGEYPNSCQFNSQQKCLSSSPLGNYSCQCENENTTYWDNTTSQCTPRPTYGSDCDAQFPEGCVHNSDLACLTSPSNDNTSVCQCKDESETYWDLETTRCIKRPDYGSPCNPDFPRSCMYKKFLTCKLDNTTGNSSCQCDSEKATYWDTVDLTCKTRPWYGDQCDKDHVDSCQFNDHLQCLPSETAGNFTCRCPDTERMYWDNDQQQCKLRPEYGGSCDLGLPDSCKYKTQLKCVLLQNRSICQCQNETKTFWNAATTTCEHRPSYGQSCLSNYTESCEYDDQLKCLPSGSSGNHSCQCESENATYWDAEQTRCIDRPEYGERCDSNNPESCNHNSYLTCRNVVGTNTSTCQCMDEYQSFWFGTAKECRRRPRYGGPCDSDFPDSCEHKDQLECLFSAATNQSVCQCFNESRSYWNPDVTRCIMRPKYGEPCDSKLVKSCTFNDELACLYDPYTETHLCQCRNENTTFWDPSSTDCRIRTEFGGECDLRFPDSCKHNDHLQCLVSKTTGQPTCRCQDVDILYWDPELTICETRPQYGENCLPELAGSCMYNDQLRCVRNGTSSDYVCRCNDESREYWDTEEHHCKLRPENNGVCDGDFPSSCIHNDHLKCLLDISSNQFTCRCENEEGFYWDSTTHTCKQRSGYNQACNPNMPNNCRGYIGMACLPSSSHTNYSCMCEDEHALFWDSSTMECKTRPEFGSRCQSDFPDSCLSNTQLKCLLDSSTGEPICRCTEPENLFWDGAERQCKPRPDHEGECQSELPDSCKHNKHLKCIDNGDGKNAVCRCQNESQLYWDSSTFQCRPRSGYEQSCNPDLPNSCKRQALLKCLQVGATAEYSCRCEDENVLFWDSYDAICKERPEYGAGCDSGFPGSCQPKSELLCVTGSTGSGYRCECADERTTYWDPAVLQCKTRPEYGYECVSTYAESCKHNTHLVCIPSSDKGSYSCLCKDESRYYWDEGESECKSRPSYGAQCQLGMLESCMYNSELACIQTQSGNHSCQCKDEDATYWDFTNQTCTPRPQYGEPCDANFIDSCAFNVDLQCSLSDDGNHICMCADENVTFWDPQTNQCKQRPYYGSSCDAEHPESCLFNEQLACLPLENENRSTCRCENETAFYWDHTDTECKPRLHYGSGCNPNLLNSCEHKSDLKCLSLGNTNRFTCQCADEAITFWDDDSLHCSTRPKYGDKCDSDHSDSCIHNSELSCLPNSYSGDFTCQCKNENDTFWNKQTTSCLTRPKYGDQCNPDLPHSCIHNTHLQCLLDVVSGNYSCQCVNETSTFWESTAAECASRPGNRQGCDGAFPDSCQFNNEQKCLYSNESREYICQCANEDSTYWREESSQCETRPEYGDECLPGYRDSCRHKDFLTCTVSETTGKATCKCINESATFWESTKSECKTRPEYGSACDPEFPESCAPQEELNCLLSDEHGTRVCQCINESSTFWDPSKRHCDKRPSYGSECSSEYPNSCEHKSELQCLYSNHSNTYVCQCADETTTFWDPTSATCESRSQYGSSCDMDYPESCQPQSQLECLPSESAENYTCQCRNETSNFWHPSSEICKQRPEYGDQCLSNLVDSCLYNTELSCRYSDETGVYNCQCHNETASFWNPTEARCQQRPEYGSNCMKELTTSCQYQDELVCATTENGSSICQCQNESITFWNTELNKCSPRPAHDGHCDKSFPDSCQPSSQLQCLPMEDGDNNTCQCRNVTADFWEDSSLTCKPRPSYGEICDPTYPDSCEHNKQLTCNEDKLSGKFVCQCTNETETFWHNVTSTCSTRPSYGDQCLPEFSESCIHNDQLVCLPNDKGNSVCQCMNETSTYWSPDDAACEKRPSYGQQCDTNLTDSCSYNSQLVCVGDKDGVGRCQCENEAADYWNNNTKTCDTRVEYNQDCSPGEINSCAFSSELECMLSPDGTKSTCQCRNETSTFWESANTKCKPRPAYGDNCSASYRDSCLSNTQLTCSFSLEFGTHVCQCVDENTTFWEPSDNTCKMRPGYGSPCDNSFPDSCLYNSDLVCTDTGATGVPTCRCNNETSTYWDSQALQCKTRPTYGSGCDQDVPGNCEYNDQLRCTVNISSNQYTCQCADEVNTFWDPVDTTCKSRPEYGGPCDKNYQDSCMFKSDLVCLPSAETGEFICQCGNETATFWNPGQNSCDKRPGYGATCTSALPDSCLHNSQLKCMVPPGSTQPTCQCQNEVDTYWDVQTNTCKPRPVYGDECDSNKVDSCRHNSQLKCLQSKTTGLYQCQCSDETSTFWESSTETCKTRPDYEEACKPNFPDSCVHKSELVCSATPTGDYKCQCKDETTTFWQTDTKKCTKRPAYGDKCESKFLESCQHNSDLHCLKSPTSKQFTCQCKDETSLFWDQDMSKCKPRPGYGKKCQPGFKNSCVHNSELECSPVTPGGENTCHCKNENSTFWDSAATTCKIRPEFGETCQAEFPNSCNHNNELQCLPVSDGSGDVCRCKDTDTQFWDHRESRCKIRPTYGSDCQSGYPDSCMYSDHLKCRETGEPSKFSCLCVDEILLFWDNTTNSCQIRPTTTTPPPIPKALFFSGDEGVLGDRRVTSKCYIENFTDWESLVISRNNSNLITLTAATGKLQSNFDRFVKAKPMMRGNKAGIFFRFGRLQCKDEGTYTCAVDGEYAQTAEIVAKTPAKGVPKLSLDGEIFGERRTVFTCSGNPGYPYGKLGWKVKFKDENNFKDFVFHSSRSVVTDNNCVRQEVVNTTFLFTMKWNGAKLRCHADKKYAEVDIWLISENICDHAELNTRIKHPYTRKKYIYCLEERIMSDNCPDGLYFDETRSECVLENQSADAELYSCAGKAPGVAIPDKVDCKKYYLCSHGDKHLRECQHGYFAMNGPPYCVNRYAESFCGTSKTI